MDARKDGLGLLLKKEHEEDNEGMRRHRSRALGVHLTQPSPISDGHGQSPDARVRGDVIPKEGRCLIGVVIVQAEFTVEAVDREENFRDFRAKILGHVAERRSKRDGED